MEEVMGMMKKEMKKKLRVKLLHPQRKVRRKRQQHLQRKHQSSGSLGRWKRDSLENTWPNMMQLSMVHILAIVQNKSQLTLQENGKRVRWQNVLHEKKCLSMMLQLIVPSLSLEKAQINSQPNQSKSGSQEKWKRGFQEKRWPNMMLRSTVHFLSLVV